jgi:hypothetical protein
MFPSMKLTERIDAVVNRLRRKGMDIRPLSQPEWVVDIEKRIGCKLPETYRELVNRYAFPPLELGSIILFSNIGDGSYDDITTAPFQDRILAAWVAQAGFFHFAKSACGKYDPICLDLANSRYPKQGSLVMKFDHEAILCELPQVERHVVSASFLELLEEYA